MMHDLAKKCRSYRRFHEGEAMDRATLEGLVELARLSPSSANLQPIRFILSWEKVKNAAIFPHVAWAGYLKDWSGPVEGERPSAYIILLGDTQTAKNFGCDHGIMAQSIMLGAVEKGYGGCMMASIKREALRETLKIPARYEILLVMALGKPKEEVIIDPVGSDGNIKYWREKSGTHHVPKRPLTNLILNL